MSRRFALALYRVCFAALVLAAIVAQLVHSMQQTAGFSALNFLSFFTIESNIIGTAVFLVAAKAALSGHADRQLDYLRGAATLYMVITGVVYVLLLSNADVQTSLPWVNAVLHYVFPLAILADWLFDPPARPIRFRRALVWLAFPLVYFAYSLVRGHFAHWYPYPFINVTQHGYGLVLVNALIIALAAAVLAGAIATLSRTTWAKRTRT